MTEYLVKDCIIKRHTLNYCEIQIGSVCVPIDFDVAEKVVTGTLSVEQLVWHINAEKTDVFFNKLYPEWSIVPHPVDWVAGNIYFTTKQSALEALEKRLKQEIEKIRKYSQDRINLLSKLYQEEHE